MGRDHEDCPSENESFVLESPEQSLISFEPAKTVKPFLALRAAVMLQSHVRKMLARNMIKVRQGENFRNICANGDRLRVLEMFQKHILKHGTMFLMIIYFSDSC